MVVTESVVRAAGGIVSRVDGSGATEFVLVHRPAYDDWTFPKGKASKGERDEDCALREVEEETGLRCVLGDPVAEISYTDSRSRPKTVKYFAMSPIDGTFVPGTEIDEIRWLHLDDALAQLTYEHDRAVLRDYAATRLTRS